MVFVCMLDRTRFDVEFACLRRWGPFVEELAQRNIPLTEYPVATFCSLAAVAQQARLARHIVRRGVQIVHAAADDVPRGNVFATPPARLVAPVVIASIRDRAPYLTAMQKRVQRYACRFADCILVNADAVKDWLIDEGYDASKISVIRNGVDLARFDDAPPPSQLRRELGLPDRTPLVGVVSRMPDARFLVVGETSPMDRDYLGELQQYAGRCGVADCVIFAGLRTDIPGVLASLDVSVMPSLNEALSNVVLESMAAGAPTVATRVGGTPEALVDGVTGILVPPADSSALADAIVHLLKDAALAGQVGHAARARIADHFSIRRMVRATEDLYVELLERKQRKRLPSAAC